METPIFKNRPNYHVRYNFNDGRGIKIDQDFWISRSDAVVGVVFAHTDEGLKVLLTKRSMKMLDEGGKWGVPCGYLDYDETLHEAMIREVYEETSLYLPDYKNFIIFDNNKKPFHIDDNPHTKRQNISLIYITVLNFINETNKFPLSIETFTNKETSLVNWQKFDVFLNRSKYYQWAFNHDQTIKDAYAFYNENFERK